MHVLLHGTDQSLIINPYAERVYGENKQTIVDNKEMAFNCSTMEFVETN